MQDHVSSESYGSRRRHVMGGSEATTKVESRGEVAQASSARPHLAHTEELATPPPARLAFDRLLRATMIGATLGRSPVSLLTAFVDWASHLALAPSLQQQLFSLAIERWVQIWLAAQVCACGGSLPKEYCVEPLPQDKRFVDPAWRAWPFNIIQQAFLMQQDWWEQATKSVPGVSAHHANAVSFVVRQILDQIAPSNFIATNPVVLRKTLETGGKNLWDGAVNLLDDVHRLLSHLPPAGAERFKVGETIAVTQGRIVYRNELIELIQYEPTTDSVHPEPIFIVPAWIMKYYILDLSPENSLVRHLVEAGYTVFIISWRNPTPAQRDLGMDDYLSLGIDAGLAAIRSIIPNRTIHAVGYCIGGTLLAIAAAALGRREYQPLRTLTLLAAQTDFADAGELTLFIDESEVTFLEDLMWQHGVLEARRMAGAFQLLRSNDLIWSRLVRDYLLGGRTPVSDLMAWNADTTHLPYRMHSEYLRRLFLNNDFASGHYVVDSSPVGLSDIDVPMFVVSTLWDHVAPWKSVYKIHLQADSDITFALTSGGHNRGIVNPPASSKHEYRIGTHRRTAPYISPDHWLEAHQPRAGSWWPAWIDWLETHSSERATPPGTGGPDRGYVPLEAAPGTYVMER